MGRYDWEEKQRRRDAARARSGGTKDWSTPILVVSLFGVLAGGAAWALNSDTSETHGTFGLRSDAAEVQARVVEAAATPSTSVSNASMANNARPASASGVKLEQRQASYQFDHCGAIRVTCVVDGDTIWLEGVKIRIADINAPEVSEPECPSEKELGDRATSRLIGLLNDGPFEVTTVGDRDEDRYGRKLRVLVRNGQSLGDRLIAEGLAKTWVGHKEPWC